MFSPRSARPEILATAEKYDREWFVVDSIVLDCLELERELPTVHPHKPTLLLGGEQHAARFHHQSRESRTFTWSG